MPAFVVVVHLIVAGLHLLALYSLHGIGFPRLSFIASRQHTVGGVSRLTTKLTNLVHSHSLC